jgi:hypothetical protein
MANVNTTTSNKKLHLKVNYHKALPFNLNIKKFIYDFRASKKAKELGLDDFKIKHHEDSQVELEVVGEKEKLWEVIKWSKKVPMSYRIKEISFHFVDITVA